MPVRSLVVAAALGLLVVYVAAVSWPRATDRGPISAPVSVLDTVQWGAPPGSGPAPQRRGADGADDVDDAGARLPRLRDAQFVWRSEDAMHDGVSLITQGVRDLAAIAPHLACFPDAGSAYAILESRLTRSRVQFLTGRSAGCVGWVATEQLR